MWGTAVKNMWAGIVHFCCVFVYNQAFVPTEEAEPSDSVCSGCLNVLDDDEYISALGQEWHLECFR